MKKILKNAYNAIIEGRTAKAEYEVAKMLHNTEFRNESFEVVLDYVRGKKIECLK